MIKYTKKQLQNLVNEGIAEDVSNATNETRERILEEEGNYKQIGYCESIYGCGGMLIKGCKTGKLFAVVGRTSAIYIF